MVLKKTLESPLDCKEILTVHPKGDQSSVFIGRTDAEAETPILWPLDMKSWLIGKDQEEKGTTEVEMVGWHHWLNGHEFGWTPRLGYGQGGLVCCGSWGRKESELTEQLNWTEAMQRFKRCNSIPGSGRSPGGGHGNPFQYSFLKNPMNRGAWRTIVHRVTKSQTCWSHLACTHTHMYISIYLYLSYLSIYLFISYWFCFSPNTV